METVATPTARRAGAARRPEIDVFFETLQAEQARYLEVVGRARAALTRDAGHLAHVSAIHSRLTRQFFDAQRSLLMHRAEVDAQVAAMLREADEVAAGTVRRALQRVGDGCQPTAAAWAPPAPLIDADLLAGTGLSPRQQIVALGRSIVRTVADAAALGEMLDEALRPDDPDDHAAGRALTGLLETWWADERAEGLAILDDARARADIRCHIAEIEADELLTRTWAPAPEAPDYPLSPVARAVQAVGLDGLRELLAALADSLYPPMESAARPAVSATGGALIVLGREPIDLPTLGGGRSAPAASARAWDNGRRPLGVRRARLCLPLMVPSAVASSLFLVSVVAWMR